MALEHRYKGVARNGKIELEGGVAVPDGAEVTVLFEETVAPSRLDAALWAESMKIINSFKGKLPVLPSSAYSTDTLYE